MPTPDLSLLTTSFVERGGPIFTKNLTEWKLAQQGIQLRKNVNVPQAMTKLQSVGNLRPYSAPDATQTGPRYTDRTLTAYQSKLDYDFDPEEFRNTYLNTDSEAPFYEQSLNHVSEAVLEQILLQTIYFGVRNPNGTTPGALADGFGKLIADAITGAVLTPIATGAINDTNGVDKFETVALGVPAWMRERGFMIYSSYAKFDNFRKDYRTKYGFKFDTNVEGKYKLDNINCEIMPVSWMGNSSRLIATVQNNLVVGTDTDRVQVAASQRRNIIEVRLMMPIGVQWQDSEAIFVNDQA